MHTKLFIWIGVLCSIAFFFVLNFGQSRASTPALQAACPDLVAEISLSNDHPQPGAPVDITVTVRNQGTANIATGFRTYLYVDPLNQPPTLTTPDTTSNRAPYLDAGTQYSFTRTGHTFAEGSHIIYAWVDRDNQTQNECNEGNNLASKSFTVGGCQPDDFEVGAGDDICSTARPVQANGNVERHNLCPVGDEDWILFQTEANIVYGVSAAKPEQDADLAAIELYTQCENSRATNPAVVAGVGSSVEWPAFRAGPLYARVRHNAAGYGNQTGYDLSVTAICSADAYEPDNGCDKAQELTAGMASRRRGFCQAYDDDWMRLPVTGGVRYRLQSQNWQANSRPILALYDQCGSQPSQTSSARGALEWTAAASGELLVRIQNTEQTAAGLNTGYELLFTASATGQDTHEPDNSFEMARPLNLDGADQSHKISEPGDQDWLYVEAMQGQRFRVETDDLGATDTVLCLYAADRSLLQCDDDSGAGLGSRLTWQAAATGRHYIRVYDLDASRGGSESDYRLILIPSESACDSDTFELDDANGLAHELLVGAPPQQHNFCPNGDEDWFRVWIRTPGIYDLRINAIGADADPQVTLYDVDGRTILFGNDDFGSGKSARILWRFLQSGVYYLQVTAFDGQAAGRGAEYEVQILPSTENPTPTPMPTLPPTPTFTPTPTPSPTPTPGWPAPLPTPNGPPLTLIVTNRQRLASFYGDVRANQVMGKLIQLAPEPLVNGLVVNLEQDPYVARAYAEWQADLDNLSLANQVADAIRSLLWTHVGQHPTIQYIVLAGDDRIIPYRRVPDLLDAFDGVREADYSYITTNSTVGMALKQNVTLTDDFYAARTAEKIQGRPVYLPELAVGRLVETPEEINSTVDRFLTAAEPPADGRLTLESVLMLGSGIQTEGARALCGRLNASLQQGADCGSLEISWGTDVFTQKHLQQTSPYQVNLLYTGGTHWRVRMGDGGNITSDAIRNAGLQVERGVVIHGAGYGGLNVPENEQYSVDLPQVYLAAADVYIGNNGFALFPNPSAEGLTSKLLNAFVAQLYDLPRTEGLTTVGRAWVRAKRIYWQQTGGSANEHDRKILHVATFYGLPMYRLPQTFANPDYNPFPSVRVNGTVARAGGANSQTTAEVDLQIPSFDALHLTDDPAGAYFSLDGSVNWNPDTPGQPYFYSDFHDIPDLRPLGPARGVIWTGGIYTDVLGFNPLLLTAATDSDGSGVVKSNADIEQTHLAWTSILPAQLNPDGTRVGVEWGQFDTSDGRERIYSDLFFEFTYSNSPDQVAPKVMSASGQALRSLPLVKLEAEDASGIQRVVVVYTDNRGQFQSMNLEYRPDMQKWVGQLSVHLPTFWLAQVVDGAGNVTLVTRKGGYFRAAQGVNPNTIHWGFLPLVER